MDADAEDHGLQQRARAELEAGRRPDAVYTALATDTPDPRAAALAVCSALGMAREAAWQRWTDIGEPLMDLVQPGEPADLGTFLELAGFFDLHRQLDERELPIRHLLDQALATAAAGGLPSGYAHTLSRKLHTGRLSEAFVLMATYGPRRQLPDPAAYWTHLLAAADLLAITNDDQFDSCVARCRQMLDQPSTPTSD